MIYSRGYKKPPLGAQVDWSHPQAAGLDLCHLLNEGTGPPFDVATNQSVVQTGAPTWGPTSGGLGRGGYVSATAFDVVPTPSQILMSSYPCWLAVGIVGTATSKQIPVSQGSSNFGYYSYIELNRSSNGTVNYTFKGANGVETTVGAAAPWNDGLPHVLGVVVTTSGSSGNVSLYFDGQPLGNTSFATSTYLTTLYTLGGRVFVSGSTTTTSAPFLGSLLWHQAGNGSVPDMAWLAREPYAAITTPASRFYMSGSVSPTFKPWFVQPSPILGMY